MRAKTTASHVGALPGRAPADQTRTGPRARTVSACSPPSTTAKTGPAVPCVDSRLDDLDVLLRHRLLLQPHGFEGPLPTAVHIDAVDTSVAHLNGSRPSNIDRCAT